MYHAHSIHLGLTAVIGLASIAVGQTATSAQVLARCWSDGEFPNWRAASLGTAGASSSMVVRSSGGNPGTHVAATVNLSGPNQTGCLAMTNDSTLWDPAIDGPLCLVGFRVDVKSVSLWGQGQWLRPLVAQSGRLFVAPGGNTGPDPTWHTVAFDPYPAVAFMAIWPPDPQVHPDFSESGAPLRFGFAVINSSSSNNGYVYTQNYDNWEVVAFPGSQARRLTMGVGCGSTTPSLNSGYPVVGANVGVRVADAPPNLDGGLFAGLPATTPWRLGPDCEVYLDPAVGLFLATSLRTDATGRWSTSIRFPPHPVLCGTAFALQAAVFPSPAPAGADLTNGLLLQVGG